MASHTPAVYQNENLPLHRGKGVDGVKADVLKSARTARQDRKALRDLSNTGKPAFSVVSKGSVLKEKSAARGRETAKNSSKSAFLTDEEIRRCHEWAKEGIEQVHFTGNELQKLQRDRDEQRVNKKVEKVMSALHEWSSMVYDLGMPLKEVAEDNEDVTRMDLEPEVLVPLRCLRSTSDNKKIEDLSSEPDLDHFPCFGGTFELKLKEVHNLETQTSPTSTIVCPQLQVSD